MKQGWIKLHRNILDNSIWLGEKFTRGQAWVDLILLANHKDGYFYLRDHKIEVKRGQVGWSILKLSNRWKWSRSKVKKFIKDLEKEQQLKHHESRSTSIITIINYDLYQEKDQQSEQQKDNRKTTERQQDDTNKNVKNEKNVENENKEGIKIEKTDFTDIYKNYDHLININSEEKRKRANAIHSRIIKERKEVINYLSETLHISEKKVAEKLHDFLKEQIISEEILRDYKQIKNHFKNWIKKQYQNGYTVK